MNDQPRHASEIPVTCAICGEQTNGADIWGHLRGAHDIDEELARWPDGEPVVIDSTLEPDDFAEDAP